jgi:phosphoribosylamine--glycine ligase
MLKSIVKNRADELTPCIVQETVEGIEISTEGWFNGKTWVKPFNHTIERKRLMEGDKGAQTGCMGNIVWPVDKDKLTESVIEPLSPLLEKVNYVGPIDINCIVDKNNAYFLEFTARPGYDAIQAWSELIKTPLFDYLYGIASQQKTSFSYHDGYAIGVRLSVSPFPGKEHVQDWQGIKGIDPPKEAMRHVWLADAMKNKEDELVVSGVDGVICCVTSRGTSVRECQRRAYRTINNIVLTDDIQYRNDIGKTVEKDKQTLAEYGWIDG